MLRRDLIKPLADCIEDSVSAEELLVLGILLLMKAGAAPQTFRFNTWEEDDQQNFMRNLVNAGPFFTIGPTIRIENSPANLATKRELVGNVNGIIGFFRRNHTTTTADPAGEEPAEINNRATQPNLEQEQWQRDQEALQQAFQAMAHPPRLRAALPRAGIRADDINT